MNWDQIEKNWSAMTQRVRVEFGRTGEWRADVLGSRTAGPSLAAGVIGEVAVDRKAPSRTPQP